MIARIQKFINILVNIFCFIFILFVALCVVVKDKIFPNKEKEDDNEN